MWLGALAPHEDYEVRASLSGASMTRVRLRPVGFAETEHGRQVKDHLGWTLMTRPDSFSPDEEKPTDRGAYSTGRRLAMDLGGGSHHHHHVSSKEGDMETQEDPTEDTLVQLSQPSRISLRDKNGGAPDFYAAHGLHAWWGDADSTVSSTSTVIARVTGKVRRVLEEWWALATTGTRPSTLRSLSSSPAARRLLDAEKESFRTDEEGLLFGSLPAVALQVWSDAVVRPGLPRRSRIPVTITVSLKGAALGGALGWDAAGMLALVGVGVMVVVVGGGVWRRGPARRLTRWLLGKGRDDVLKVD